MDEQNIPNLDNIDQGEARQMLQKDTDEGFDGLPDMAALALGRERDTIESMLAGDETLDEDLVMQVLGIAQERDIDLGKRESSLAAGSN